MAQAHRATRSPTEITRTPILSATRLPSLRSRNGATLAPWLFSLSHSPTPRHSFLGTWRAWSDLASASWPLASHLRIDGAKCQAEGGTRHGEGRRQLAGSLSYFTHSTSVERADADLPREGADFRHW